MPYEKGGRADKNGNRFETRWAVFQILQVLEENIKSITLEALGEDEKGIDIWVGMNDGKKEGQQCKGRNASQEYWDYSSIKEKGIFETWKYHLDRDLTNTVSLVSPLAFTFLEDLTERARTSSGIPSEFYKEQILGSSKKFINFFDNFCIAMAINKEEDSDMMKCISYLQRIFYHQVPDSNLKDLILGKISYLLVGDGERIYSTLVSWIVEGEMLGQSIDISAVYSFLEEREIELRDLVSDVRIQPRINQLNREYKESFTKIDGQLIDRNEFAICRKMIDNEESIIIHGKAGRGKSGCTVDIIEHCEENVIPYLAVKLDRHVPKRNADIWGQELGLAASIAYCIDSISKDKQAVLILDQLDALRWTQSHSHEALSVCQQIIDQVNQLNYEREKNISIVFVCRSYDLENDNNISNLFKENIDKNISRKWNKVQINELNDEVIFNIIGDRFNSLTSKLKEVLRIPSNLYIWKQLDPKKNYAECTSTSHLVEEWWKQLSKKCIKLGLNEIELNSVKNRIVDWLEKRGRIYFPINVLDIGESYINFLSSNSFLVIQDNKAFFAHQSILDYFLANNLMRKYYEDEDIIEIIGDKDNQTPSKRYQVQMFLEMLLEQDSNDFLIIGQKLFESDQIRYFVKFIFLEILNQIDLLDENIKKFILDKCEDKRYEVYLINNVYFGKPQYVRLLRKEGIFTEWLKESEKKQITFKLMGSISPNYDKEDVLFMLNYSFKSEEDDNLIINCLPYDINEDTDELFELRMMFYGKYPEKADGYLNIKNMIKSGEMRIIRLLALLLENNKNKHGKSIYRFEEEFLEIDKEIFINNGVEILNLLIPYIPKEIEKMYSFSEWSEKYTYNNGLERACINILKKANFNIIMSNPDLFLEYYKEYMGEGFYLFNELILDAMYYLPKSYSDLVIEYLMQDFDKNLFVITDGSNSELTLAKKVLGKHTMYCSLNIFRKLENNIIKYIDPYAIDWYKRRIEHNKQNKGRSVYWSFYGDFQKELLEALPTKRISPHVLELLKVLNRKFPDGVTRYINHGVESGTVTSNLYGKKLDAKQWLNIITNKKIKDRDRWHWTHDFVDDSIKGFSDSFRNAVSKEPEKMINLLISNQEVVFSEYVDALFSGVASSENIKKIPIKLIEEMIVVFSYDYESYRASYICDILEKRSNEKWTMTIIQCLSDIAVNHKNPEIDKVNVTNFEDQEMKSFEMLQSNALNCVRGNAARTIGSLLWDNSELFKDFQSTIERMTLDENAAVKLASFEALIPSYNINKEWASELIISLYEQDFRLAGMYQSKTLMFFLYPKYREQILQTILKCYESDDKGLIRVGAYCLSEMYILKDEYIEILSNIDNMSEDQANGVLDMAINYFDKDEFNEKIKDVILKFKNSELDIEVPISKLFRSDYIDLNRDKEFLLKVMDSNMSRRTVHSFVMYLEQESVSIIDYSDIIIAMSYQIIMNRDSCDNYWGIDDEISKLVVGLYDETSESSVDEIKKIGDKCLDIWDLMFENNIGSIRSLSKEIMDR
ncbi:NACHT domain-containing protein [Vagococcus fluvialis]|uniref:hypothetical protein n=1 Tax=Vagococcus fluvialis TaxID=2738 RepID=UPI001D0B34F2|nr:hypothetical protein [Vagococcus fluvialis]UDM71183.1 hypothetical protein K5L00_13940 [Vagococcus fluvialis]UDM76043.1 hypothetical protein K5K98_09475 [Vagococcus fluvialis]UDM82871.1 hypothetical protein K5K96_02145 [Vagococcus fluvialis]